MFRLFTVYPFLIVLFVLLMAPEQSSASEHPMALTELEYHSDTIISGVVQSATLLQVVLDEKSTKKYYQSTIKVITVTKGEISKSETLEITWSDNIWYPNVIKPSCDTPRVLLPPCEEFDAYLKKEGKTEDGKTKYVLVHWSAKNCVKNCNGKLPRKEDTTLECKKK